jgi:hypothetical protein
MAGTEDGRKEVSYLVAEAKEVLNPYEWLPSYGESGIRFWSEDSDVVLEITYDGDEEGDSPLRLKRHLRFVGVCALYKSSFPSPAGLVDIKYDSKWLIGSLVEFRRSEVADAWMSNFANQYELKHYLIQFTSENLQFHAIAKSYMLSEALGA